MKPASVPIVDLRQEEVVDAKNLSIAQKLALSGDLFDWACEVTLSGIRAENPGISDDGAVEILRRRLELARRLETRL